MLVIRTFRYCHNIALPSRQKRAKRSSMSAPLASAGAGEMLLHGWKLKMNSRSPRSKTITLSSLCFRVTYLGERDMHERLPTCINVGALIIGTGFWGFLIIIIKYNIPPQTYSNHYKAPMLAAYRLATLLARSRVESWRGARGALSYSNQVADALKIGTGSGSQAHSSTHRSSGRTCT